MKATLALCTHLRGLANKLVACRSKGDGGLSKASASTVAALTNDVAAASVTLKMEERRGLLATEACKQVVQDDKAALDQHHLQLQNLLYERENRALQVIPVGNTSRFVARQRRGALPCGSTSCAVCAARQT